MRRINDFTEIKAYCDVFNEKGHKGFKEPINPFFWWNFKRQGKIDDKVHAYIDDGLVMVLELENGNDVKNMLVFSLCEQKNILYKILDICKDYGIVSYNSEYRNRYKAITKWLDGTSCNQNGRFYYSANGEKAWARYVRR